MQVAVHKQEAQALHALLDRVQQAQHAKDGLAERRKMFGVRVREVRLRSRAFLRCFVSSCKLYCLTIEDIANSVLERPTLRRVVLETHSGEPRSGSRFSKQRG